MSVLFTNNASTILASSITAGQTTIALNGGTGALFPNPVAPDVFYGTLISAANPNVFEIVKVTARATDTLTVVRAQEGTTGQAFNASDLFKLLPTTAGMDTMRNVVSMPTSTGSANAQVVANSVPLRALVRGATQTFIPGFNNTGDTTLAIDGLPATHLNAFGQVLLPNMLLAGVPATVYFDGTVIQLENPQNDYGSFNPVINGDCRINQRVNQTLSTAFQLAGPDRWAAMGSGTAVSAGTIQQAVTALLGTSGYALEVAGATITGAGVVTARYRIESRDVQQFVNQQGIIALHVYHNVGSAINYTITVNAPTAQDNFASVTTIGTSAAQSVPSATDTIIQYQLNLGAVGNGIEIQVAASCGAVTTKNFYFTELQLRLGTNFRRYPSRPEATEFNDCLRYFQVLGPAAAISTNSANPGQGVVGYVFGVKMRAAPTVSIYNSATVTYLWGSSSSTSTTSPSSVNADVNGVYFLQQGISPGTIGNGTFMMNRTLSPFQADAEL